MREFSFTDFLKTVAVAAIICVASVLTASAQCPGGVCPQPRVVNAPPVPLYRAPVRRAIYEFFTPAGVLQQGYLVRPVTPLTYEQAVKNAAYWNAQAAKLGAQQPVNVAPPVAQPLAR